MVQEVYETFEPPLDDELRELLFDVTRIGESQMGRDDKVKMINWGLMAEMLDYNRIQPWEKTPEHDCISRAPCISQISESMSSFSLLIVRKCIKLDLSLI